jgi:hypothetical protein
VIRLLDSIARRALAALTARVAQPKTFGGNAGPYLSRWTLLDAGKYRWRLCLHHFHRSDEDRELHTHPWSWAVALQLAGGYREERRERCPIWGDVVRSRVRRPGHLVFLRADTAHRVDVLDEVGGSWSLILIGPVTASWGFWDRETGRETPWREFIQQKGLVPLKPEVRT